MLPSSHTRSEASLSFFMIAMSPSSLALQDVVFLGSISTSPAGRGPSSSSSTWTLPLRLDLHNFKCFTQIFNVFFTQIKNFNFYFHTDQIFQSESPLFQRGHFLSEASKLLFPCCSSNLDNFYHPYMYLRTFYFIYFIYFLFSKPCAI